MWARLLTTAFGAAEWLVERKRRRQAEESVPVQLLTDGYFEAMADDIQGRIGEGRDLKKALQDVYEEQGPVLLRPAPKQSLDTGWMVAASVAAVAVFGLAYWHRR
jgi:hypothetical protein